MNPRYNRPSNPKQPLKLSGRFANRANSLQLLVLIIGLILIGRLFYLQVVKHGHYNAVAAAEHQKKFTIPATRGSLYFRDGSDVVPAVLNSSVYTLYADPPAVADAENTANVISAELKLDRQEILKKLKKANTSYVVITKRLSRQQVDNLFKQKTKLQGVNVTEVPQRVYPEGLLGSQLLGFVNDEGVGQYGVEGALNKNLSGKAGELKATTDVNGVPLSLDDATNIAKVPKDGQDTVLTVDRNIQAKAEEALANGLKKFNATKGSVVVLDPNTGAVRAMANVPTYDPAKYYEVGNDAYERFRNRVVSDPYEAGSVIKVLTMSAGLNENVVNKDTRYNNTGSVQVDDRKISNAAKVPGSRTMSEVLQHSLNTGVVYVLTQLGGSQNVNLQGREKLFDYFTKHYGLGDLTGIEQIGESPGILYSPKDVQGNNVRYANMAFGQGMDVTMIQVASAFASVVNGGSFYQPHLVEGAMQTDGSLQNPVPKPLRTNVVRPETSSEIRYMIRTAVQETPVISRLLRPGYNIGGKTGTSQIIDPKTGQYIDTNAIGTYVGYGGDDKPRYVIMVRVDDAKLGGADYAGSVVAAPIFAEISNWLLDYYNISPM
jgi:cell division protein FtsI/penicillin-binding protein 2